MAAPRESVVREFLESAQAARGGIKGKKNSAELAAARESVVRELMESPAGSQLTVEQLWHSNKVRSVFSNLLLIGDVIYMSRGSYGPGLLTSAGIRTGDLKWSARGFTNANFLRADGKVIILDEDGWLMLAVPNSDGSLKILSKAQVLSPNSWTVPTLAGTTLYLRDRKTIMALDVGAKHSGW
ncbi:MAG: hypothetical protein ACRD7E_10080 [Bryobacteraceae bacterium]